MLAKIAAPFQTSFSKIAAFTLLFSAVGMAGAQSAQTAGARPVADRLTSPIVESVRTPLTGTVHRLATKANDTGAVADGMKLERIQVVLKRSDAQEAELKKLVGELHSPGSASYHKWLTPDAFGKQFGPSDADVTKLESWLAGKGFSIAKLNAGRQTLEISGTAGQFKDAFHAQIHSFKVNGETRFSNVTDPDIPAAIAPVFGGFASTNNFRFKSHMRNLGKAQFNPATHESKPNWTIGTSTSNNNLVLAPADFNVQYDLNPLYAAGTKGDGQSIAIVNEANINIGLVNDYRTLFGLPANPPQVIIDGNDPGIDGINSPYGPNYASGEAYLDVEFSGAVAPDAQINLVIANDTALEGGLTLAAERAVYSNVSPIISLSFGGCEADQTAQGNAFFANLWEQAAAQGITVLVSSGDNGSAGCDNDNTQAFAVGGQAVNGLGSTPYNVSVGGTDFYYANGASDVATYWNLTPTNDTPTVSLLKVIPEQPWNNSQYGLDLYSYYDTYGTTTIAGGSGGASNAAFGSSASTYTGYPKPAWQTGTGVPADGVRDLPDVSLFAANGWNNSYYPLCASDGDCQPVASGGSVQISGVGGTSASTPAFAGMMALVNQRYGRQGQANFVLYPLAAQFPAAFHDVTAGTNSMPCDLSDGTPDCKAVAGGLTATDKNYGTATEGEISVDGTNAAYNAGTGYDLATGLGTVDASNLVNDWNKITFATTATTLTTTINGVAATTFAHGTAVTIAGAVTGSAATPTGDVGLITTSAEPNNQGETFFTLASGAYTGSVSFLPGGTYDISGYYGGDSVNGPSTSTPVQITVTPEASVTALSVYDSVTGSSNVAVPSGGSISYGASSVLSALVGASSGTTTTNPTGTVAFLDGATTINSAAVNVEGDAEFNYAPLPGSHSIMAKYSGDGSYNASNSTATSFTVTKNTPQASVTFLNAYQDGSVVGGQVTYLIVQVENSSSENSFALAPTGTVTISGAPAGTPATATLVAAVDPSTRAPDATAYFAVPATASGNYNISFSYGGDTNYNAASIAAATYDFAAANGLTSTTTATTTGSATSPTGAVQITATVTGVSGHGAPTGTVYLLSGFFNSNGVYTIGQGTLTAGTGLSSSITFDVGSGSLFQGTNQIQVFYQGDSTYNSSSTTLTIANPLSDFSLIPATTVVNVPTTGITTDVINLESYNGFAGAVGLTCQGTSGVTCSLSSVFSTLASGGQNQVTLTVNTGLVPAAGTYNVLVTGTDATGKFIHTIGLQVATPLISTSLTPAFTLAGSAVTIAAPGGTGTSAIITTPVNGFTGAVVLTCAVTGPTGAVSAPTCSAASATVTGTTAVSTPLTFSTTAETTPGSYTATVTGTSGSVTAVASLPVTVGAPVVAPTFTVAGSTATIASQGASGTSTITVTPGAGGFTGTVALTCALTSSPSGASEVPTCSLAPASVSLSGTTAATSTLTINTTAQTAALTPASQRLFGESGGAVLALLAFFGIAGRRGRRAVKSVRAVRILSAAVLFALIAGAGIGCGGGGSTPPTASGGTTTGTYTFTVTGTSGSTTATIPVTVTVQ